MRTKLLIGTSKGLIIFKHRNNQWNCEAVQFEGLPVSMVYVDERTNTWWVALSHRHWGEKLQRSLNEGASWQEVNIPNFGNHLYRPGKGASLKKIWVMQHAGASQPGGLWMGTEPGGLFYSPDGKEFQLVESLWNHPSRMDPNQWFGAGKDYPFIHSIVLDPQDSRHVYIGVSCAGVFETHDNGITWQAKNKGLVAAYLPNPNPEVGHDPHRMLICTTHPEVIWQQNHCGIFRTSNGGEQWNDVSGANGFPKYGFALAIEENDPDTAWVIPAQSDEHRTPVGLHLTVCKTSDGGKTWVNFDKGLPHANAFDIVLRHSFVKSGGILVFGTNNGNLYTSEDSGSTWRAVTQNLPMINYVTFA